MRTIGRFGPQSATHISARPGIAPDRLEDHITPVLFFVRQTGGKAPATWRTLCPTGQCVCGGLCEDAFCTKGTAF